MRGFMVRTSRVRWLVAAVLVAGAALPGPAFAQEFGEQEERPSTGTGQIIVGWIATGVGAVNLATLPVCYADFYPSESKDLCVGASLGLGVVGLGLGIPFLAVGYSNRSDYLEWKKRNPVAVHLSNLRITASGDAGFLTYRSEL